MYRMLSAFYVFQIAAFHVSMGILMVIVVAVCVMISGQEAIVTVSVMLLR